MTKPKVFRTSADQRAVIRALAAKNWESGKIAELIRLQRRTVARHMAAISLQKSAKSGPRKPKTAQEKRVAARRAALVVIAGKTVTKDGRTRPRFATSTVIADEYNEHRPENQHISRWTVQRDLRAMGFKALVRKNVPKVDAALYRRRKLFCERAYRWPWFRMMFSDEKIFTVNDGTARTMWVKPGNRVLAREQTRFPTRVMVWAAMADGFLVWYIVPNVATTGGRVNARVLGTVTSENYCAKMLPKIADRVRSFKMRFVQDGAKPHTARATIDYLRKHGITFVDNWPAHSPDLNPIEKLWAIVAPRVAAHFPRSYDELVNAINAEFRRIRNHELHIITNLCRAFPERCRAVYRMNGRFQ